MLEKFAAPITRRFSFFAAIALIAAFSLLALASNQAQAAATYSIDLKMVQAEVMRVVDGDTVIVLPAGSSTPVRIRLAYIDTPEKRQNFGSEATQLLNEMIAFQSISYHQIKKSDRYGRVLAVIYNDGLNVNLELIKHGLAWSYYAKKGSIYHTVEARSIESGVGIWDGKEVPVRPSEFRKFQ